ncbi:AAA family ATPase [Polymorphobacter fuscus]|uniref:AAA family ATPase n=2 Tax=Sandarakinorhabdus fusca TaxID=1439888 RepID=A0A7C9GV47_9SPHN|nr:ATP-binding protein [Polymorphobacter fuscus]MQT17278.1 AAA family ATPase [Polymorphobacter fuscus]
MAAKAWFAANDAWLAAMMAQLRHRLNLAAPPPPAAGPADMPAPPPRRGLFGLWGSDADAAEPTMLLPPPGPVSAAIEEKRLADAVAEAEAHDPPPALVALGQRFQLTPFERDILALCVAAELDPGIAAALPGGRPSFAIALAVLPDGAWEALAPDRPLRHWQLVAVDRGEGRSLAASPLRIDERILNHAKGLQHRDARLAPLLRPLAPAPDHLPGSQWAGAGAVATALGADAPGLAVLRGSDLASKHDVAAAAAAAHGLSLYSLAADDLPAAPEEIELLARLWHREALLAPLALFIDAQGPVVDGAAARAVRFAARSGGPLLLASRAAVPLGFDPLADVEVQRPTAAEQVALWQDALADTDDAIARPLAGRFDLDRRTIADAGRAALSGAPETPLHDRLMAATRDRTRPRLDRLADRVAVKAGLADIVLPPAPAAQLAQLVAQVENRVTVLGDWGFGDRMNRGMGVSALFVGDSGTGKTMAAEAVAHELGLDLYRIDLSAVVSKYIGETEKNLGALFDAAEAGSAVLLFDEADALFGKRSEVKDAHDRFANIEIDYLLQRMEAFRGLAILTTNMKAALDPAFTRRLRFIVDFPYPGAAERERIWQRAFPPAVPLDSIDVARLARLDLTGAAIQSVALNAAFAAADRGTPVTMPLLMDAARAEFRKLDRPVNEADFRTAPPVPKGVAA